VVEINEAYIPPSAGAVASGFAVPAPAFLRNSDPGDTVPVEVVRDRETQELPVTFAGRSGP
jgi:hypothetical protein